MGTFLLLSGEKHLPGPFVPGFFSDVLRASMLRFSVAPPDENGRFGGEDLISCGERFGDRDF
jgi:hypothetical protein